MSTHAIPHRTLISLVLPAALHSVLGRAVLILMGSALIALSAQIEFMLAFSPVPITMQTAAIMIIAAAYGRHLAVATVVAYLAEGASGLPVFAGGSFGVHHFAGPTGGYLIGFIGAAWLVGALAERGWDRGWRSFVAMTLGTVVIFICGLAWLANFVPATMLFALGVAPFIPGAVFKCVIAAGAIPSARQIARRFAD